MAGIQSLGYLRDRVGRRRRLGASSASGCSAWPRAAGPTRTRCTCGWDDFPARLVIVAGERDRLLATGWEVTDEGGLAGVEQDLAAAGVPVKAGTSTECAERRGGSVCCGLRTRPATAWKSSAAPALDSRPFRGARRASASSPGTWGLGHAVLPVTNDEAAVRFYRDVPRLPAARLDADGPPSCSARPAGGPPLFMRFLGCNPRQPLAGPGSLPGGVRAGAPDDRGGHAGRCRPGRWTAAPRRGAPGLAPAWGGHANDLMVSFYVRDAGGIRRGVRHRRPAGRRRYLGQPGKPPPSACGGTASRRRGPRTEVGGHFRAWPPVPGPHPGGRTASVRCSGTSCTGVNRDHHGRCGRARRVYLPVIRGRITGPRPLVLFCPRPLVGHLAADRGVPGTSAANVLADGQRELARVVREPARRAKFDGVGWSPSPAGLPVLDSALAWVTAAVETVARGRRSPGGDRARHRARRVPGRPGAVCFYRGRYALSADGADDGPPELVDTLLAWPRHADWI